ncbi:CHC2 zinc finger domain-containing protein [Moraxella nasovis]|uniref:CHC2 zinc finger domain-containing protein n=1 Tax=Moraxella nasovis TaxID=2904121 RepID=UPI001F605B2B|nr:CHC2 zinc finger domain-containing protein [Moraxella nasovis]UNU72900.1 CHC2 zinc finger domain-containing protein [Moraxella nasovis]
MSHSFFKRPSFFNQGLFGSQKPTTDRATNGANSAGVDNCSNNNTHASTTAKTAQNGTFNPHQGGNTTHAQNHAKNPQNGANMATNPPYHLPYSNASQNRPQKRMNTDNKPDPVSFYARYGIALKGNQTNVKCVFHGDKTPSLSINRQTGAFFCFGCGASGGDVLDFYQRYHNCDFLTACRDLNLDI